MKTILIAAATASALTFAAAPLAAETREERAEARLAELIEGRVAGEPVNCINASNGNRIRVIDNVGIVYERGDTLWVARATSPNQLDSSDVPVIERFGSQLCHTDVIRTIDRYSGFISGSVFLEEFVPYTREG